MTELIRVCLDPEEAAPPPADVNDRMALVKDARWGEGFNLRIRFLGGDTALQEKVKQYANEWRQHANILFTWVKEGTADVRVAFERTFASWSQVGREALKKTDQNIPTMNFGWFDENTSDQEIRRVVLHEFGHALGCIHEHQHPENGIQWDTEKVYAYYKQQYGWDRARVDRNVLNAYSADLLKATGQLDPDSIMLYPVDARLTNNTFSSGWNNDLSALDKKFIKSMYP